MRSAGGVADPRLEPLVLSQDERRILENWAKRRSTAQGLAVRARIVLASAEGGSNLAVAARLGVNRSTVTKWRARFLAARLDGLGDEPRPGVPRTISDAQVEEVVVRTLEEVPEGATHWSKRELAKRVGISPTSVHRPIDRTSGPFLVDLLRPGLAMGQASSSLITRTEAGWARRLAMEGPAVSGLRKRYSLKPLPAIPGTHCGPPAEAGTRSPSGDVSDCNAVRCSAQYHAWPFRESDRLCDTRVPS